MSDKIEDAAQKTVSPAAVAALKALFALAYAAWCLANDSEDLGDGYHKIDHDNFVKLCNQLDALDELPDDQPGYTMEAAAKARWALRDIIPLSVSESDEPEAEASEHGDTP